MNLKFYALTIALLLSIFAPPVGAFQSADSQPIDSKIENLGSSERVKVVGLMVKERDGFLSLQFEIANSDEKPNKIYYRVKWLDASGFQVWDDEPWKPVLVQGGARQNLQVRSPTPKARDFRVQYNVQGNRSDDSADSKL